MEKYTVEMFRSEKARNAEKIVTVRSWRGELIF
jgi:hypothetical protein